MDNSPIAKLSPELRNQIYGYAVRLDLPIRVDARCWPLSSVRFATSANPLALTQTCQAIRQECRRMFFASNHFHFCEERIVDCCAAWQALQSTFGEECTSSLQRFGLFVAYPVCFCPVDTVRAKGREAFRDSLVALRRWQSLHPRCEISITFEACWGKHLFALRLDDLTDTWGLALERAKQIREDFKAAGNGDAAAAAKLCKHALAEWRDHLRQIAVQGNGVP